MLSCDLMTAAAKPAFVALPPVKHLRLPASIHFPDEAMRPEGSLHLFLRILLQRIIHVVLGDAERARTAEARVRATEERARADRLEARLRALGVDPEGD